MKFTLELYDGDTPLEFENLDVGIIFYTEGENILDTSFKVRSKSKLKDIMTVYNDLFILDDRGGTNARLIREGGAGIKGRIYIYPIDDYSAKIHLNFEGES